MNKISATVLFYFSFHQHLVLKRSGAGTGATILVEENTSLFDYLRDDKLCLSSQPASLFWYVLLK
jgi:hypothetical protein